MQPHAGPFSGIGFLTYSTKDQNMILEDIDQNVTVFDKQKPFAYRPLYKGKKFNYKGNFKMQFAARHSGVNGYQPYYPGKQFTSSERCTFGSMYATMFAGFSCFQFTEEEQVLEGPLLIADKFSENLASFLLDEDDFLEFAAWQRGDGQMATILDIDGVAVTVDNKSFFKRGQLVDIVDLDTPIKIRTLHVSDIDPKLNIVYFDDDSNMSGITIDHSIHWLNTWHETEIYMPVGLMGQFTDSNPVAPHANYQGIDRDTITSSFFKPIIHLNPTSPGTERSLDALSIQPIFEPYFDNRNLRDYQPTKAMVNNRTLTQMFKDQQDITNPDLRWITDNGTPTSGKYTLLHPGNHGMNYNMTLDSMPGYPERSLDLINESSLCEVEGPRGYWKNPANQGYVHPAYNNTMAYQIIRYVWYGYANRFPHVNTHVGDIKTMGD